jgi:hypothetical protein
MSRKSIRWIFVTLILSILMNAIFPPSAAGSAPGSPAYNYRDTDAVVEAKIEAALPQGLAMVDHAIARLSQGAEGLSTVELALFERFFDPAGTGEMNKAFVLAVLENYRKIQSEFASGLVVEYETANSMCIGMRLYYTESSKSTSARTSRASRTPSVSPETSFTSWPTLLSSLRTGYITRRVPLNMQS